MMQTEELRIPRKLAPVFNPSRGELRHRGAYGGRGSGKSRTFATMAAVWGAAEKLRILCARDLQVSIKESFHAELKAAIAASPSLTAFYDVGVDYLRGKNGTEFLFRGLRHNMGAIKSMSAIDLCIVEEAEDVSAESIKDLLPTIRAPKSEIWWIWNPRKKGSAVDAMFRQGDPPPRSAIVQINYNDNKWFPQELEEQRLYNQQTWDAAMYAHVWEGAYLNNSKSQVLAGKWHIEDFVPQPDWGGPYYGADWGFSNDPTALVRCWVGGDTLYIEHEAGGVGCEMDDLPAMFDQVPGSRQHVIRADCSRPETISHVCRRGFRVEAAPKWAGSVEDGITYLRSFRRIVIHSRCREAAKEAELYSYKVDRYTGEVTDVILDAHNHYIDSIRYALAPLIQAGGLPMTLALRTVY